MQARSPAPRVHMRPGPGPGLAARWCLSRLGRAFAGAPVRFELWDGTSLACADEPVATVTFHDFVSLARLLANPELGFGEAYTAGRLTVTGDLVRLFETVSTALADRWPGKAPSHIGGATPSAAQHNVHAHYDLGNEFYRLWLDDEMVYTCAYFAQEGASLEAAQRAKMDHVCRKLALRPGERVVEAGCGWGALALHMAREYGARVDACNISESQLDYARERAKREGLADRVRFLAEDYRSLDGTYDAFVSIGMVEHVGADRYRDLGVVIDRVLDRDHGRGLLHFIGRNQPREFNAWTLRYIFPGAHAPTAAEVLAGVVEPIGLSVLDVENLRPHYARTIQHWRDRFEARADVVAGMFDATFVRTWRLYLAMAQAGFQSGDLQLFQILFARPHDNTRAWTRAAWYPDGDGTR